MCTACSTDGILKTHSVQDFGSQKVLVKATCHKGYVRAKRIPLCKKKKKTHFPCIIKLVLGDKNHFYDKDNAKLHNVFTIRTYKERSRTKRPQRSAAKLHTGKCIVLKLAINIGCTAYEMFYRSNDISITMNLNV